MKNKIYTRTGDRGMTSLSTGERVQKDDPRIAWYGELDELNACLGCLLACKLPDADRMLLGELQNLLFEIGGLFPFGGNQSMDFTFLSENIGRLEHAIDLIQSEVPFPKGFILPGGCPSAAWAHLARTVCRRVERTLWHLPEAETFPEELFSFINRLSDYLYALSLKLNFTEGKKEILWRKRC